MIKQLLLSLSLISAAVPAQAQLSVFACEPEWGALSQELGGDQVKVYNATHALQDPHHIQARPALISHLRRADLAVCTGAELEIGWLPVLISKAGNARIRPGSPNLFYAADYVTKLEIPQQLDRANGDIHAAGNPHIQTDPRRIAQVAKALTNRLQQLDPGQAEHYQQRYHAFNQGWQRAIARWQQQAAPLKGKTWVIYHDQWVYLEDWLGLKRVGELEPKPGLPPTPGHLAELNQRLRQQPPALIARAAYKDQAAAQWLSKKLKVPAITLPFTIGGTPQADNLEHLFDDTLKRLLQSLQ